MNWWFLSGFNYEKIERCQESCHWRRQRQEKEEKKSQQSSPRSFLTYHGWRKRCNTWVHLERLFAPQVSKGLLQFLEMECYNRSTYYGQGENCLQAEGKKRVDHEFSALLRNKVIQ
jgi:hypothetical protein